MKRAFVGRQLQPNTMDKSCTAGAQIVAIPIRTSTVWMDLSCVQFAVFGFRASFEPAFLQSKSRRTRPVQESPAMHMANGFPDHISLVSLPSILNTSYDSRIRKILIFMDYGADDKTDQHTKSNPYSHLPYLRFALFIPHATAS